MATNEAVRLAADDDRAPGEAPVVKRGLTLPCPLCGEENATISVSLADGESMYCADCEGDFSAAAVRRFIDRWGKMLSWLDRMPGEAA